MDLVEFPNFDNEAEAKRALSELASDTEELIYEGDSMRSYQRNKAKRRLNGWWSRFIGKCSRLSDKPGDAWNVMSKKGAKLKTKMMKVRDIVKDLDGVY
ncbi:hypothetical protein CMI47_10810 [Candidatus Pacearchaeota archaeon]|nr:hypothetical protein [Candidatus Pacearchaeota archaeon]